MIFPLVGVVMGSDSDLPIMKDAIQFLENMGIAIETKIVSAHRTPDWMFQYAKKAHGRGLKVIIAGAGGAAHLPGMIASLSPLPVIGVPILSRLSIKGLDSLLSIAQMPPGIPVATVAVNGAKNAGILALEILGSSDKKIREKVVRYKKSLETDVKKKRTRLDKLGVSEYLKRYSK